MHHPLLTFDFDESGDNFQINCLCADCLPANSVPVAAPTSHMRALAIALLAACDVLEKDLADVKVSAVTLSTTEERHALEVRYRERLEQQGLHDFVERPVTRPEPDYIDHRVIAPVQRVIVDGKPPGKDAA